ncbi:hypothetical protein OF83DRAFT_1094967 [Amylostereum chailletii]|nr:hypothetical protein OF83DRAFT_1094967 [Amylostereum chailletii]
MQVSGHNNKFGTDMQLSSSYYSVWYKNPEWGSISETLLKVVEFYETDQLKHALPVPGAADGLRSLNAMGYELVIITARKIPDELESTETWLRRNFEGTFKYVVFSSQSDDSVFCDDRYIATKLSKLEICVALRATCLVDDSMETAQVFGRESGRPFLLFGDYEWNQRVDSGDRWSFQEKLNAEGGHEWWKHENIDLRNQSTIRRMKDWYEVVAWARCAKKQYGLL